MIQVQSILQLILDNLVNIFVKLFLIYILKHFQENYSLDKFHQKMGFSLKKEVCIATDQSLSGTKILKYS